MKKEPKKLTAHQEFMRQRDDLASSIPYRPLPPICTIPVDKRAIPSKVPAKPSRKLLTGDQLVNWRKAFPLMMFFSDAEINRFADGLQNEIDSR